MSYKEINRRLDHIERDVKSLLRFKWQIMGGAGAIGALIAFSVGVIRSL